MCGKPPATGQRGRPFNRPRPVTQELLDSITAHVKSECTRAAQLVLQELRDRFPTVELLDALSMAYPQYFQQFESAAAAKAAMAPLVSTICSRYAPTPGADEGAPPPLLDRTQLVAQRDTYADLAWAVAQELKGKSDEQLPLFERELCPTTRFWRRMQRNAYAWERASEWAKLGELALVLVPGSVEEERLFSCMNNIKNAGRNRLEEAHLNACVRMKCQRFFTLHTFPFAAALKIWRKTTRYME
jgi:hypothetical protein